MDNDTIDRAYEIIYDRPGITRGQLTAALATPGHKGSDRTSARAIAWLRDKQHRITSEGRGYRAIVPACVPACVPNGAQTALACQHRNLNDLAPSACMPTPGSKGLNPSVTFGTQTGLSANSNTKNIDSVENPRMEDENQASSGIQDAEVNNGNVEVDTLTRSTITGIGEPEHLDTEESNMNDDVALYNSEPLADVIDEVSVLLALSVSNIKSRNQSNGYQIGAGWKKSMVREPWEHLQYALDLLAGPEADVFDLLLAIRCLAHSDVTYEAQPIPWEEIEEMYPRPPARAITPIIHPGPPEDWEEIDPEWEEIWRALNATSPVTPDIEPVVIPAAVEAPASPAPGRVVAQELAPLPILAAPVARGTVLDLFDESYAPSTPPPIEEPEAHFAEREARLAREMPAAEDQEDQAPVPADPEEPAGPAVLVIVPPSPTPTATTAPAPKPATQPVQQMRRRPGEDQASFEAWVKLDREIAEILASRPF